MSPTVGSYPIPQPSQSLPDLRSQLTTTSKNQKPTALAITALAVLGGLAALYLNTAPQPPKRIPHFSLKATANCKLSLIAAFSEPKNNPFNRVFDFNTHVNMLSARTTIGTPCYVDLTEKGMAFFTKSEDPKKFQSFVSNINGPGGRFKVYFDPQSPPSMVPNSPPTLILPTCPISSNKSAS